MGKKRKRDREKHPRNKYSDNPTDFSVLASLYPSLGSYVFYSQQGKPKIDWKDFNATRELTRVLLLHHHSITCNTWYEELRLPQPKDRDVYSRRTSGYFAWSEDASVSKARYFCICLIVFLLGSLLDKIMHFEMV